MSILQKVILTLLIVELVLLSLQAEIVTKILGFVFALLFTAALFRDWNAGEH